MDCYVVPKVVNFVVLYCASGCESWYAMRSQWLWIMVYHTEPVVNDSWWAMLSQWLWIMVCYANQRLWIMVFYDEPVAVNYGLWCCTKGCESW
jgi:hypothetical protein